MRCRICDYCNYSKLSLRPAPRLSKANVEENVGIKVTENGVEKTLLNPLSLYFQRYL